MPFLLIAALLIAAIALPPAAAEAAPRDAGAPTTPGGGFPAAPSTVPDHRAVPIHPVVAGQSASAGHRIATGRPVSSVSGPDAKGAGAAANPDTAPADAATRQPASDGSIPLTRRSRDTASTRDRSNELPSSAEQRDRGRSNWIATTIGGLGIALGAFLLLAWMVKRNVPAALRPLPGDVVQVLGRAPLAGRQQMHVLRFANKLVLVSITPAGDTISLAEIEDSDEVSRVVALCNNQESESSSESFRRLLHQFGQEPTEPGFVDAAPSRTSPSHSRPIDRKGRPS